MTVPQDARPTLALTQRKPAVASTVTSASTAATTSATSSPVSPPHHRSTTTQRARIQCKPELVVSRLQEFFSKAGNLERVLPFIDKEAPVKSPVSQRLIDWFCTNHAKKRNVGYAWRSSQFLVYSAYKRELKAYSKRMFDPFCRRDRILFQVRGHKPIETTIGQLNFFRWALDGGVLDYIEAHREEIERDMNTSIKEHYRTPPAASTASSRTSSTRSASSGGGGHDAKECRSATDGVDGVDESGASGASGASGIDGVCNDSTNSGNDSGSSSRTNGNSASTTSLTSATTALSSRSSSGRRRRTELSKSAMKKVNMHASAVLVSFD